MLRRYPHELSGGQQQRVMFAMALATNPDLLVLDEPTTGLDTTVEAEVLDLVSRLRSKFSASILFISHNLGIVARMCERVGVLYAGRLIEEGASREIFSDPRHPYTLGLLRCVPNRLMRKDAHRLDPIAGSLPPLGLSAEGCVYAPRCPIARVRCRREDPPALASGPRRLSRCFYHAEVPQIPKSEETLSEEALSSAGNNDRAGNLLRVEGLSKRYGAGAYQVVALDDVSIELGSGEILGLVGESGSGKSTLAKCVVGLLEASRGTIGFAGQSLTRLADWRKAELRRKLQMVFQNPDTTLNPSHTARRILTRAARLLSAGGSAAVWPAASPPLPPRCVCGPITSTCGHPSSRAASSSASRLPAPSPARRPWCFATSRPRRSTFRSRRPSSISWSICRRARASPISSFHMTLGWCVISPTASR